MNHFEVFVEQPLVKPVVLLITGYFNETKLQHLNLVPVPVLPLPGHGPVERLRPPLSDRLAVHQAVGEPQLEPQGAHLHARCTHLITYETLQACASISVSKLCNFHLPYLVNFVKI